MDLEAARLSLRLRSEEFGELKSNKAEEKKSGQCQDILEYSE